MEFLYAEERATISVAAIQEKSSIAAVAADLSTSESLLYQSILHEKDDGITSSALTYTLRRRQVSLPILPPNSAPINIIGDNTNSQQSSSTVFLTSIPQLSATSSSRYNSSNLESIASKVMQSRSLVVRNELNQCVLSKQKLFLCRKYHFAVQISALQSKFYFFLSAILLLL
jgi:hypothetical protein